MLARRYAGSVQGGKIRPTSTLNRKEFKDLCQSYEAEAEKVEDMRIKLKNMNKELPKMMKENPGMANLLRNKMMTVQNEQRQAETHLNKRTELMRQKIKDGGLDHGCSKEQLEEATAKLNAM